ncbi:MAG: hybrid sensor histidine kinase/response regulator [Phycisphaerales bacterium JB052]
MYKLDASRSESRSKMVYIPIASGLLVATVLFVSSLISIAGMRHTARIAIDQEVRRNLARMASMAAATIDPSSHSTLTDSTQEDGKTYKALNKPLAEAIERAQTVRFIYTLRAVGDDLCFVLDGTPIGDADNDGIEDHSFLMDVYEDPDPAAWEALRSGDTTITHEPYRDRWGTFLSGFAPVVLDDGTIDGVVGVDVSVDHYQAQLARVDLAARLALIPGGVLSILAGLTAWWISRRFVRFARQVVEHREDAIRANNAKSSLLASISHELRTPLNAIIGFVGIAGDEQSSNLERADATDTIRYNAEHLLTLINDLLDISKAEAGMISIEPTAVDLPELIERAVAPLRFNAEQKGIGFIVEGVDALPNRVMLDRTRVRQILLNLLSNAVKFTNEGHVKLQVHAEADMLVMCVRDTGPGILRKDIEHLFSPFTQLGSRENRMKGTGLGLTITHKLTKLMGGEIEVESKPGKGTLFRVRLPYQDATPACEHTTHDTRAEWEMLSGVRVAIAEDGVDNLRLLKMIFMRSGASTIEYHNGEEALAGIMGDPDHADLLITDWDMPVLNGEGLVRKLREAGWTRPIISLTAHAMAEQQRLCLSVGCDAHMTKPINAKRLIQTCAELVEQHGCSSKAA